MDLDDLKAGWAERDRLLANAIGLNAALMRETVTARGQDRIRRAGQMRGIGLLVWIAFVAGFGMFLAAHFGDWKFFAPALVLDIWTIAMGVITLRERGALTALDFGEAPLELQQTLAHLRMQRARTVKWAFLTGQLVWWIPFAIVLFKGLLGVDLYTVSAFMPKFLAWNLVGGLVFIPVALLAGKYLGPMIAGSSFSNTVLDAISGRDMAEARAMLGRVRRFQEA